MISEPHPDVRRLLERMVARMGDWPIAEDAPTPAQLRSIDALLVEPQSPRAGKLVQLARAANPSLSIVCASVAAPAATMETPCAKHADTTASRLSWMIIASRTAKSSRLP